MMLLNSFISIASQAWRIVTSVVKLIKMLLLSKYHSFIYSFNNKYSFIDHIETIVDTYPERIQFISVDDGVRVSLIDFDTLANRIGHWTCDKLQCKQHDTIAILMLNRPELISLWVGFGKVGVTSALINTNSTGSALLHSVDISTKDSANKILIVDSELKMQISNDLQKLLDMGVKVIMFDELMLSAINSMSSKRPKRSCRDSIIERDPLMYIFTSGTTGLPKASKISHSRYYLGTLPYSVLCDLTPKDIIYTCLPLYHSAAGMLGVGATFRSGACMVMRKKFSASNFVSDCVKYKCTSMQYIGELASYCLSVPRSSTEDKLLLKTAFGNGMRKDIWIKFQQRYGIKHIVEFYAATEGNLALFNSCDTVGALGFVPRIVDSLYPVKIVKVDPDNKEMPLRDSNGRCINCSVNEVGLMIGEVDNGRVDRRFDGYTDSAASKKKILSNVFKDGDVYFNSGDLLYRDLIGFFYWADRVGDTFRWKGENVSTAEVENALMASSKDITDCAVYGVEIPGCDGKAGMAAIVLSRKQVEEEKREEQQGSNSTLFQEISTHLRDNLPSYARPPFIRLQSEMAMTSTFKHKKNDLIKQGYDMSKCCNDRLYVFDSKLSSYKPLTKEVYNDIINSNIRL